MTDDRARIAALTAEIARLEVSVASDGQAVQALRHDLDALRAELAAVGSPAANPVRGPTPDKAAGRAPNDAAEDPDGDMFDDVPV